MPIENDTNDNCEYLPCCNDKWHNMLLKLFDHSVHENLANSSQYGEYKEINA